MKYVIEKCDPRHPSRSPEGFWWRIKGGNGEIVLASEMLERGSRDRIVRLFAKASGFKVKKAKV